MNGEWIKKKRWFATVFWAASVILVPQIAQAIEFCTKNADCNDEIECTTDTCNKSTYTCVYTPVNSYCDDGLYCTGVDVCDPANGNPETGCYSPGVPCSTGQCCYEDDDLCSTSPPTGTLCASDPGEDVNIFCPPAGADRYCTNSDDLNYEDMCVHNDDCAPHGECTAYYWSYYYFDPDDDENWSLGHRPLCDEVACIPAGMTVQTIPSGIQAHIGRDCGEPVGWGIEGPMALYIEDGAMIEKLHHASFTLCRQGGCGVDSVINGVLKLNGDFNLSNPVQGVVGDLNIGEDHTLGGTGELRLVAANRCYGDGCDGNDPCGTGCPTGCECAGGNPGISPKLGAAMDKTDVLTIGSGLTVDGPRVKKPTDPDPITPPSMFERGINFEVRVDNQGTIKANQGPLPFARPVGGSGTWTAIDGGLLKVVGGNVSAGDWVVDSGSDLVIQSLFSGTVCSDDIDLQDPLPLPSNIELVMSGSSATLCGVDEASGDCDDACTASPCGTVSAPVAESPAVKKNRYISFDPGSASGNCSLLVMLKSTSSTTEYVTRFENRYWWVGAPEDCCNGASCVQVAELQCDRYARDWSYDDVIHVFGRQVMPEAEYEVRMVCDNCASSALTVYTGLWGDVDDNDVVNMDDVQDVCNEYSTACVINEDIAPYDVDQDVGMDDVQAIISAYEGDPYPYEPPDYELLDSCAP